VFLANYVGPRTQVVAHRLVDLPILSSTSTPPAFELALSLDLPWRYREKARIAGSPCAACAGTGVV
jgi:hypothetical protein